MLAKDELFETIFKKDISSGNVNDYLQEIVGQHPYFTAAHFFLLQKTDPQHYQYDNVLNKTTLLFNNAYWLNYTLSDREETMTIVEEPEKIAESIPESTVEIIPDTVPETIAHIEEPVQEEITAEPTATISAHIEETVVDVTTAVATETTEEPIQETEPAESAQQQINIKLPDLNTPVTEDTISFEPLHTTDYFASQGIKLSDEIKPDDKLGKSLKSFTEWLKTMKKVSPTGNNIPGTSENAESNVQQMAEQSNAENEVITEAMADVLIQQGKRNKAVEVYQKLSLLNPSKNAYFAAKIENLKAN